MSTPINDAHDAPRGRDDAVHTGRDGADEVTTTKAGKKIDQQTERVAVRGLASKGRSRFSPSWPADEFTSPRSPASSTAWKPAIRRMTVG